MFGCRRRASRATSLASSCAASGQAMSRQSVSIGPYCVSSSVIWSRSFWMKAAQRLGSDCLVNFGSYQKFERSQPKS